MLGKGINHYSAGWSTQVTHWAPFVDLSIVPSMKGESGPYTNIFTHFVSVGGGWRHNCSLISRSHDPLGNSSILRNPCTMACTWASGQFHGSVGPAQLNHESLKKSLKAELHVPWPRPVRRKWDDGVRAHLSGAYVKPCTELQSWGLVMCSRELPWTKWMQFSKWLMRTGNWNLISRNIWERSIV